MEEVLEEKSDRAKIADLIIENQTLRHKATILAELLYAVSSVLYHYGSVRLPYPLYTIVDPSIEGNSIIQGKPKYKIVDVLEPSPDKEFLLGKEIYDIRYDVNTALNAYNEIFKIFKELDIEIKEGAPPEEEDNGQLHIDFSKGETDEN